MFLIVTTDVHTKHAMFSVSYKKANIILLNSIIKYTNVTKLNNNEIN